MTQSASQHRFLAIPTASSADFPGRQPYESWWKCGSTTGSSSTTTVCVTRSATVGMPNGRVPPLSFSISTSRTGGNDSPTTSDSRPYRDCSSGPFRMPPGLAVHTAAPCRLHPLVRIPHELLRNHVRLCSGAPLLPSRVDRFPKPESRAPSLRPHYQASSLPRARPPLRLASYMLILVGPPLGFSFASRRQVPTFRTRACTGLTPSSCRPPLGQSAGILRAASQANDWSLVSVASLRFRHVINGSLAFVFPAHT